MRLLRWTLIPAFAVVFAVPWAWGESPAETQSNGLWSAWLEMKVMPGTERNRAQTYEQKLYIRGPSSKTPSLLLTGTSTGRIHFWLGPDGILAAQPIGRDPCVFFPGKEEPNVLEAPRLKTTNTYSAHNPVHLEFNDCWFSGGALLYESRMYGGADYIIGLFMIDTKKKTVSPGRVCLELNDPNGHLVQAANVYGDRILFVGTHVFWLNTGWDNSWFPDAVKGTWRNPQIRAFDLDQKQITSGSAIPMTLLTKHKEALERVFGAGIVETIHSQKPIRPNADKRRR